MSYPQLENTLPFLTFAGSSLSMCYTSYGKVFGENLSTFKAYAVRTRLYAVLSTVVSAMCLESVQHYTPSLSIRYRYPSPSRHLK